MYKRYIRTIPDFPKPGIRFRDVTGIFLNPIAINCAASDFCDVVKKTEADKVAAIDARGFVLGGMVAVYQRKPLILVRKKGKLPGQCMVMEYDLEYGKAAIEIQKSDIKPGDRIFILDDLIATGGTALAAIKLIQSLGGVPVGLGALVDLPELGGSKLIEAAGVPVTALCAYNETE